MRLSRLEAEMNQALIVMKKEIASLGKEDCAFMCKHLCGYSCASQKVSGTQYAQKEGVIRANMLPKRDPAERMARVGQGYSHMLSMVDGASMGVSGNIYETKTAALKVQKGSV
jgi:hypothetical protein